MPNPVHWSKSCRQQLMLLCLLLLLSSCNPGNEEGGEGTAALYFSHELLSASLVTAVLDRYLTDISSDLATARTAAESLHEAVRLLLESPSAAMLEQARERWSVAHRDYEGTTLHRYFMQQAISLDPVLINLDITLSQLLYRVNHWPILPGYIDYLAGYPDSGVVSDITLPLSREALLQQHGAFDLSEALLGFHPLEFLLWGENPGGNSPRPVADYVAIETLTAEQQADGLLLPQLPDNRRRQLLELVAAGLVEDIRTIEQFWLQNQGMLRAVLERQGSTGTLAVLLDSINLGLTEEILVKSLYPLLNGETDTAIQSPFSGATEESVMAMLASLERILNMPADEDVDLSAMLVTLLPEFNDSFFLNFDATKACLALLYSRPLLEASAAPREVVQAEFEIVECINLVTNLTNTIGRVRQSFP